MSGQRFHPRGGLILSSRHQRWVVTFDQGRRVPATAPCRATASYCQCAVKGLHTVHACDPATCTAQWEGMSLEAPDFRPIAMPRPVR